MNIERRLNKVEAVVLKTTEFIVIAVDENETPEQANQRAFPAGSPQPRTVIYATPLDHAL